MSHNSLTCSEGRCDLSRFERNRYFHGKLMTARDMEAEQNYTIGRQNLLTRNVLGEGLVCGMNVTKVEVSNQKLNVSLDPGVALDRCGNPIVVTKTGPVAARRGSAGDTVLPDGNEISLYVKFVECEKESVAIPHSENPCKEECCYNRTLETFEIFFEESAPNPPIPKSVEDLTFPTPEEVTADRDRALGRIARSYYRRNRKECKTSTNPVIFLGKWKEDPPESGTWVVAEEEPNGNDSPVPLDRPHVYNNDMLYAAISRHTADFDNPHQVTAKQTDALESVDSVRRDKNGNVDFKSNDNSITINPDIQNHTISFQTSAKQLNALESIEGVGRDENGNIDLTSDSSITISPDNNGKKISLTTSAVQVNALESVNKVQRDDEGDVEFVSEDNSVTITPNPQDHTIDLSSPTDPTPQQKQDLRCVDFDGFLPSGMGEHQTPFPIDFRGVSIGSNITQDHAIFVEGGRPAGLVKLNVGSARSRELVILPEKNGSASSKISYTEIEVTLTGFPEGPTWINLEAVHEDGEVTEETHEWNPQTLRHRFQLESEENQIEQLRLSCANSWAIIQICTRMDK